MDESDLGSTTYAIDPSPSPGGTGSSGSDSYGIAADWRGDPPVPVYVHDRVPSNSTGTIYQGVQSVNGKISGRDQL